MLLEKKYQFGKFSEEFRRKSMYWPCEAIPRDLSLIKLFKQEMKTTKLGEKKGLLK
jgi:hypothetical protein